jgi:hypothetical protein
MMPILMVILNKIFKGYDTMKLTFLDITSPQLLEYVQLKEYSGKAAIFRFFALEMVGIPLKALEPLADIMPFLSPCSEYGDESNRIFDEQYARQLSEFPATKFDLGMILEQLQLVEEVIIVSNYNHPVVTDIVDSLCKYIQQKYALQAYIVKDIEDVDPFTFSEFESNEGYQNYVRDVEWMIQNREEMTRANQQKQ